tara:strand:- start:316 stop:1014 length:699 start_codon:yes stop_codon:yes gene_type:complete
MYKQKKILAIVPARKGSKGIKNKNLKKINGFSLIAHSCKLLSKISHIDLIIISTDSDQMGTEGVSHGADYFLKRPNRLAGDRVGDYDVLKHALTQAEKVKNTKFDIILMIQPTCPLRKKHHVVSTYKKLIDENLDSVWTISKIDLKFHPYKLLKISKNKLFFFSRFGKDIVARQQLNELYFRNGAAYAFSRDCIIKQKKILGKNSGSILIEEELINIDTKSDILKINKIIRG